jgi:hypothetical protein
MCTHLQEVSMRDDTTLVEDAAAALHVSLHRAEAWARIAAARGVLLGEASVALAALATFEGSYTYGDQQAIAGAQVASQVGDGRLSEGDMRKYCVLSLVLAGGVKE